MTGFDFSPLFRSTVGFDRLAQMLASRVEDTATWPPYNIEKTGESAYRVTLAVAGFGEGDLDLNVENGVLTVRGKSKAGNESAQFLHRGIAGRGFERRFQLADYVEVKAASLENGLLHVDLAREIPEAMKPRRISIGATPQAKTLEAKPTVVETKAA